MSGSLKLDVADIAVHKDNVKHGRPAVWLVVDPHGGLYEATGWSAEGPSGGRQGAMSHGPTIWVHVYDVTLYGAQPI